MTATPTGLETRALSFEALALRGAAEAWREDQVERGGRALAAVRTTLPVLRGAIVDATIPPKWRARFEALAAMHEDALTGRRR